MMVGGALDLHHKHVTQACAGEALREACKILCSTENAKDRQESGLVLLASNVTTCPCVITTCQSLVCQVGGKIQNRH
jgi:hypothetical protein